MSLVELIARADERGLAAGGLACLDRCVSLLGGDDEILRPLWAGLADGAEPEEWTTRLEQVRVKLQTDATDDTETTGEGGAEGEAVLLARRMLAAAPATRSAASVREWADACSVAALRIHRLLDASATGASSVDSFREGRTEGMPPLVEAELRRQTRVLELLAEHGAGGLRQAMAVSTEGRRVLRAVVSRRARGRA
ncbi:hypothetical protein [Streptomyces geranii]|uniref:hypothetical protein n=1 Tax=Streptomyces geranii TaxID=2058923 RepID=UPI000D02403A|nr:hypothetical protein [Streptomyces geranii]